MAGICQFGCDDSSHGNDDNTPDQPNDTTSCKTEGFVSCNGICIDPNTSNNYCGANVNCENYEICKSTDSCFEGRCRPTACEPDEHRYLGACEKDSLEHCGAHNFACATEIEGWITGVCENHQCIPTECAPGECPEEPSVCKANTECNAWEKCEEGQCVDIDEEVECYDGERFVNGVCVHEGMLAAQPGDPCEPEWQNYSYCNDENHSVYCWFDGETYTLMKDECEKCQYIARGFRFITTCDNAYSAQCDEPGAETQICKIDMSNEMAGLGKEVCTATEDGAYVKLFTGFTSYCNEDNPELSSECNDDFTACKEVLPCEYGVDSDSCSGSILTYCSEEGEYKTQDCAIVGMECLSFSGLFEQTVASCMSPVKCKNEGMLEETCNSHKVYTSYCAKAQDDNLYRIEVLSDICANGYGPCRAKP